MAPGHRARTGAARASSNLEPNSNTANTTNADPSTAAARCTPGWPGSAVATTVSVPVASAPSISIASTANTRTYREHPDVPRDEAGPEAVPHRRDIVQRLVGGEHHAGAREQQTDQAD